MREAKPCGDLEPKRCERNDPGEQPSGGDPPERIDYTIIASGRGWSWESTHYFETEAEAQASKDAHDDRIRTQTRAECEATAHRNGKAWAYEDITRYVEHPDWAGSWTEAKQSAASAIQSAIDRARAEGRAEGLAEAVREPGHPHQGQPFRGQTPVPACVLKRACPVCNAVKGALCFNPKSGHPWATSAHSRRGRPTEEGADDE